MCDDVHGGNILLSVCAVRVIGESDMMQDFLAAGDMEDVSYWICYLLSLSMHTVAYIYIRLLFVCFCFSWFAISCQSACIQNLRTFVISLQSTCMLCFCFSWICYFLSINVHTELATFVISLQSTCMLYFCFSWICYFLSINVHTELAYICYFFAINMHAVIGFMSVFFFWIIVCMTMSV